jgi:putative spermidine/putrescine transport system permease protein
MVWTTLVVLFVLAPLFFTAAVSFTTRDYMSFPTDGLTLRWYYAALNQPAYVQAALNSLLLAFEAALTATVLGVIAAVGISRSQAAMRGVSMVLLNSPLFTPLVMNGIAIRFFFSTLGWRDQGFRLYVAHATLTIPYVVRTVLASAASFDLAQERAARNLGAGPLRAFWLVSLPQLAPGVMAGMLFAFIISFDNVGILIFLSGSQFSTLPVELFNRVLSNDDPAVAAASVLMILVSMIVVGILERLFGIQRLMR